MRPRLANLISDAIDIITNCDGDDAQVWLTTARAELQLLDAKAALRAAVA